MPPAFISHRGMGGGGSAAAASASHPKSANGGGGRGRGELSFSSSSSSPRRPSGNKSGLLVQGLEDLLGRSEDAGEALCVSVRGDDDDGLDGGCGDRSPERNGKVGFGAAAVATAAAPSASSAPSSPGNSVPLRRSPTPRPGGRPGEPPPPAASTFYDPADEDDLRGAGASGGRRSLRGGGGKSRSLSSLLANDLRDLVTCGGNGAALKDVHDEGTAAMNLGGGILERMQCGTGGSRSGRGWRRSGGGGGGGGGGRSGSRSASPGGGSIWRVGNSGGGGGRPPLLPPVGIVKEWDGSHRTDGSAGGGSPPPLKLGESIDTYEEAELEDEMYRLRRMTSWNTHGTAGTMGTMGTAGTDGTYETYETYETATTLGGGGDASTVTSAMTYASGAGGSAGGGAAAAVDVAAALGLPPSPERTDVDRSASVQSALSGVLLDDDDGRPVPPELLKLQQQRSLARRESMSRDASMGTAGDVTSHTRSGGRRRRRRRRRRKLVQFDYPPISSLRECPRIDPADRSKLFFTEDELDQIEDDRAESLMTDDVEVVAVVDQVAGHTVNEGGDAAGDIPPSGGDTVTTSEDLSVLTGAGSKGTASTLTTKGTTVTSNSSSVVSSVQETQGWTLRGAGILTEDNILSDDLEDDTNSDSSDENCVYGFRPRPEDNIPTPSTASSGDLFRGLDSHDYQDNLPPSPVRTDGSSTAASTPQSSPDTTRNGEQHQHQQSIEEVAEEIAGLMAGKPPAPRYSQPGSSSIPSDGNAAGSKSKFGAGAGGGAGGMGRNALEKVLSGRYSPSKTPSAEEQRRISAGAGATFPKESPSAASSSAAAAASSSTASQKKHKGSSVGGIGRSALDRVLSGRFSPPTAEETQGGGGGGGGAPEASPLAGLPQTSPTSAPSAPPTAVPPRPSSAAGTRPSPESPPKGGASTKKKKKKRILGGVQIYLRNRSTSQS